MSTQTAPRFFSTSPADGSFTKWFKRTTPIQRDRFLNLYKLIEKPISIEELKYNRKFEKASASIILAVARTLYNNDLALHLTHLEDDLADLGITKGQMVSTLQSHNLIN